MSRRRALVTGGSRGIGLAVARALALDGLEVVATWARDQGAARAAGETVRAEGLAISLARCDAASPSEVEDLLVRIAPVDVLVHAAGSTSDRLLLQMSDRQFDDLLAVHLTGGFLASRQAAPGMLARGWGRIVYLVSATALLGRAGQVNYAAAKAGLVGLCRALARELGPHGVTVNCVSAGLVDTALTSDLAPALRAEILALVPLSRAGRAEEVAAAVAFLCSDRASYLTGQVLSVDGGLA